MLDLPDASNITNGNSIDYDANSQGLSSKSLRMCKVAHGGPPITQGTVELLGSSMTKQRNNEDISIL